MLTKITLKDYTTFIEETTFDLTATNYKILESTNVGVNRVLKGALFIGENASGKTQALDAIVLLLDFLLSNSEPNFFLKKSLYTKGTKFTLTYSFDIDGNTIDYAVTFDGIEINTEELYLNGVSKLSRIGTNGKTNFGDTKDIKDLNLTLSLLKLEYYNTKFNNDTILNKWFDFLKNSLYINCLTGVIKSYNLSKVSEQIITKYAENKDATKINQLIKKMKYTSEVIFNKQPDKEIMSIKKSGTNIPIPLSLESTGNKIFISTILPFNYATTNDCMLIVDEFSSGLHNELEETLVKYFFNNSHNSQLFFTSHSTNLLDTTILRPDQIYTFHFDNKKGTLIKRFSDESPRESQNIEKMYLNGVFDGMPKYDKEFKD